MVIFKIVSRSTGCNKACFLPAQARNPSVCLPYARSRFKLFIPRPIRHVPPIQDRTWFKTSAPGVAGQTTRKPVHPAASETQDTRLKAPTGSNSPKDLHSTTSPLLFKRNTKICKVCSHRSLLKKLLQQEGK